MDSPKPRQFQFGLRALFIAFVPVAIVALPLGWYLRRPVPPRAIRISGIVTLDGQPLDGAMITLFPVDSNGRTALGVTDAMGRFVPQTHIGGGELVLGAFPGSYRVTLKESAQVGSWCPPLVEPASAPTERVIPEEYADLATSGLRVAVTVGAPNVLAFSLTSE